MGWRIGNIAYGAHPFTGLIFQLDCRGIEIEF